MSIEKVTKWDLRTILQALLLVLGAFGLFGTAIGGYVATSVRLAEYDLRLTTLEHDRDADRASLKAYQDEMRIAVARAIDLLTDVRLKIATLTPSGSHAK